MNPMKMKILKTPRTIDSKLKWATGFLYVTYFVLLQLLFITNAIVLTFFIPVGVISLALSIYFWISCVAQEAREKELI